MFSWILIISINVISFCPQKIREGKSDMIKHSVKTQMLHIFLPVWNELDFLFLY